MCPLEHEVHGIKVLQQKSVAGRGMLNADQALGEALGEEYTTCRDTEDDQSYDRQLELPGGFPRLLPIEQMAVPRHPVNSPRG